MQIKLYKTTDGNSVLEKTLTAEKTISNVDIVEPCNVLAPAFILRYDSDVINYNYCYAFGKYYFIAPPQVLTGGRCVISCAVDVLKTYAKDIKACKGVCIRSESIGKTFIVDNKYPIDETKKYVELVNFPDTPFTSIPTNPFILTTIGSVNFGNSK